MVEILLLLWQFCNCYLELTIDNVAIYMCFSLGVFY